MTVWNLGWKLLQIAQVNKKHRYATPVVTTVSPAGTPRSRTVVLRHADPAAGTLQLWTDRRSTKATHLTHKPVLIWLFWDPRHQLQLSAHGPTHWLGDDVARKKFLSLPKHSRRAYATRAAPGAPLPHPADGLPPDWQDRSLPQTDYAAQNFGILETRLEFVELLQLSREGHRRLRAQRDPDQGEWRFEWMVP